MLPAVFGFGRGLIDDTHALLFFTSFRPPNLHFYAAARYKMRMKFYQMYGRLRCDKLKTNLLIQDSIGGETDENKCSVKRRGCNEIVSAPCV